MFSLFSPINFFFFCDKHFELFPEQWFQFLFFPWLHSTFTTYFLMKKDSKWRSEGGLAGRTKQHRVGRQAGLWVFGVFDFHEIFWEIIHIPSWFMTRNIFYRNSTQAFRDRFQACWSEESEKHETHNSFQNSNSHQNCSSVIGDSQNQAAHDAYQVLLVIRVKDYTNDPVYMSNVEAITSKAADDSTYHLAQYGAYTMNYQAGAFYNAVIFLGYLAVNAFLSPTSDFKAYLQTNGPTSPSLGQTLAYYMDYIMRAPYPTGQNIICKEGERLQWACVNLRLEISGAIFWHFFVDRYSRPLQHELDHIGYSRKLHAVRHVQWCI